MIRNLKQKDDLKEFLKIALELQKTNKKVYESYKNRMIGALEVQQISKDRCYE